MDCIFCKIIKGEIPSYKIYEDNVILAFLDVNPYSPGHTLIVPKEHTLDIETIPEETINHIMKHAKDIAKLITKKLIPLTTLYFFSKRGLTKLRILNTFTTNNTTK